MKPGAYVPDVTEGIIKPKDLPRAKVETHSRDYRRRPCPICGKSCSRQTHGKRVLHDLGLVHKGRPLDIHLTYSIHYCQSCKAYFNTDMSDLASPGSHYTQRVIDTAVRLVVEDGLPYRAASWHMWRDHRVFVPWATIQNWVEAAGEKRRKAG